MSQYCSYSVDNGEYSLIVVNEVSTSSGEEENDTASSDDAEIGFNSNRSTGRDEKKFSQISTTSGDTEQKDDVYTDAGEFTLIIGKESINNSESTSTDDGEYLMVNEIRVREYDYGNDNVFSSVSSLETIFEVKDEIEETTGNIEEYYQYKLLKIPMDKKYASYSISEEDDLYYDPPIRTNNDGLAWVGSRLFHDTSLYYNDKTKERNGLQGGFVFSDMFQTNTDYGLIIHEDNRDRHNRSDRDGDVEISNDHLNQWGSIALKNISLRIRRSLSDSISHMDKINNNTTKEQRRIDHPLHAYNNSKRNSSSNGYIVEIETVEHITIEVTEEEIYI